MIFFVYFRMVDACISFCVFLFFWTSAIHYSRNASHSHIHTHRLCANLNYGTVHSSSWNWFVQHLMFTAYCSACKQTLITIYTSAFIICACNWREERTREREKHSKKCAVHITHTGYKSNSIYQSKFRCELTEKNTRQYISDVIWIIHCLFVAVCLYVSYSRSRSLALYLPWCAAKWLWI